jgi:hypothetical protein
MGLPDFNVAAMCRAQSSFHMADDSIQVEYNFIHDYEPLADRWGVWDNLMDPPRIWVAPNALAKGKLVFQNEPWEEIS